jgi:putative oxidoreductase
MSDGERYAWTAGRVLLSLIFILSALGKLADLGGTAAFMRAAGIPAVWLCLPAAILIELGGGLAILTGWAAGVGALVLVLFLIPTTVVFHPFWQSSGMERTVQMVNFMKNLAIMGGLLIVVPARAAAERATTP